MISRNDVVEIVLDQLNITSMQRLSFRPGTDNAATFLQEYVEKNKWGLIFLTIIQNGQIKHC